MTILLPDLLFFRPTRGMVVKDFAPSRHHYGVDMAASVDESVLGGSGWYGNAGGSDSRQRGTYSDSA